jgi:hypothetical protein
VQDEELQDDESSRAARRAQEILQVVQEAHYASGDEVEDVPLGLITKRTEGV